MNPKISQALARRVEAPVGGAVDEPEPEAPRKKKKTVVIEPVADEPPAATPKARTAASPPKKKKKKRAVGEPQLDWRGQEHALESYLGGIIQHMVKVTGNTEITSSDQTDALVHGIPFPSLAQCIIYRNNVQVLGRCQQIAGLPGSAKTLLLYDMMKHVMDYRGFATKLANEGKDAPDLRHSVYGHRATYRKRTIVHPTRSLEDWMEGLTFMISKLYRDFDPKGRLPTLARKAKGKGGKVDEEEDLLDGIMPVNEGPLEDKAVRKKNPGYGWTIPWIFGIDSLMATASRSQALKITTTGAAERGFAIDANLLSTYCKTLPLWLGNNPILVVGTNHMKPSQDAQGKPTVNIPGGWAFKFMETFRIQMSKVSSINVKESNYGGIKVKMQMTKNSLGETGNALYVQVIWRRIEQEDGRFRQYTEWDWHTATTEALLNTDKLSAAERRRIHEVVDLKQVGTKKLIASKALGSSSAHPLTFHEAGALIDANQEMREALYPIFGVTERRLFEPGVEYYEQVTAERLAAFERARKKGRKMNDLADLYYRVDSKLERKARDNDYATKDEGREVVDEGEEDVEYD